MKNQSFSTTHLTNTFVPTPFSSFSSPQSNHAIQPAFFSIKEAATYLNVCEKQIYTLVHIPDFPATKIGKHWRINIDGLHQWLSKPKSLLQ